MGILFVETSKGSELGSPSETFPLKLEPTGRVLKTAEYNVYYDSCIGEVYPLQQYKSPPQYTRRSSSFFSLFDLTTSSLLSFCVSL